jgi:Flp pilus assembly protein TadB
MRSLRKSGRLRAALGWAAFGAAVTAFMGVAMGATEKDQILKLIGLWAFLTVFVSVGWELSRASREGAREPFIAKPFTSSPEVSRRLGLAISIGVFVLFLIVAIVAGQPIYVVVAILLMTLSIPLLAHHEWRNRGP